jgi:hypothetical protein
MNHKSSSQPPQYYFCLLLDAVRDSDFDTARHANARLRERGIEVSFHALIPPLGSEPAKRPQVVIQPEGGAA